jgi:hypothetical protein
MPDQEQLQQRILMTIINNVDTHHCPDDADNETLYPVKIFNLSL